MSVSHDDDAAAARAALQMLLRLQELDQEIDRCRAREVEIPKQKNKFEVYRERLKSELEECEQSVKKLELEQRDIEGEIQVKQDAIAKYNGQLASVKKNEEYQALLHEIDREKKKIAKHEERIIEIMMEMDDARERLEEDRKRIAAEMKSVDEQCAEVDAELSEAIEHRESLEAQRKPLVPEADRTLLSRYERIRKSKPDGKAIVPLKEEVCGGCHMHERAQIVNEVMAGEKVHVCQHCGRMLYYPPNFEEAEVEA